MNSNNYNQPQLPPTLQLANTVFVFIFKIIIKPFKYIYLKATEKYNAKRGRKTA